MQDFLLFYQHQFQLIQQFYSNSTSHDMDQRVFYGLLERVGGNGRYQTILLCVWSILMMVMGFTTFFLPFLFYQSDYQCPEGVTNCKDYVCSLPAEQRTPFIHNDMYSLATKFGDYRCDNNVQLDRLQSFIYFGGVVGVLIGTFINQVITKRKIMIITVSFNIIGLGIALLGNSILFASIGLFLNVAACAIEFEIIQCIIVQTVSQQVRGEHIILTIVFHGLGVTLNGLIFYLLKNGLIVILILIPILVVLLMFIIFYIQETPYDLVISNTPEDSLAVLKKIAIHNNRENEHNISLPELQNVKREFDENQQKKQHSSISFLDLFRYDSLRTLTIVSLVLHYVTTFQFIAPEISIRNYSLSIYTNGVVIGSSEFLGSIVCYFIIDHYARKKMIYITQAICILSSVPVFIFLSCPNGTCSHQTQILQTLGLAIFRFAATISFNFFYLQQYQAFPNQIRGLALQFVCLPSYFAAVTLPQIISFCERTGISIVISFVLCTIIVLIMLTCLPETYGIPPPEIIEELKYEHREVEDQKQQEKIKLT